MWMCMITSVCQILVKNSLDWTLENRRDVCLLRSSWLNSFVVRTVEGDYVR